MAAEPYSRAFRIDGFYAGRATSDGRRDLAVRHQRLPGLCGLTSA